MSVPGALTGVLLGGPADGVRVYLSRHVLDGVLMHVPDGSSRVGATALVVGTGPWTELDRAREEGRRIARNGLGRELAWLGERVGPAVDDPYPAVSGREFLEQLRGTA